DHLGDGADDGDAAPADEGDGRGRRPDVGGDRLGRGAEVEGDRSTGFGDRPLRPGRPAVERDRYGEYARRVVGLEGVTLAGCPGDRDRVGRVEGPAGDLGAVVEYQNLLASGVQRDGDQVGSVARGGGVRQDGRGVPALEFFGAQPGRTRRRHGRLLK